MSPLFAFLIGLLFGRRAKKKARREYERQYQAWVEYCQQMDAWYRDEASRQTQLPR